MEKRKFESASTDAAKALVVKKSRTEEEKGGQLIVAGVPRTSSLQAPIVLLEGHQAEIYTCKFDPSGKALSSAGFDKRILLWQVQGDCTNYHMFEGHKNAIQEIHWSTDGERLFSASADKTVMAWDTVVGVRVKKLAEHTSFVNSCCPSRKGGLLVSGSDDKTVKLWDMRRKRSAQTREHKFQVTAVAMSNNNEQVYFAGIDGKISVWDLRRDDIAFSIDSHRDIVTSIQLSPDGNYLLSNSMDNSLHVHDMRPFVPGDNRLTKVFTGAVHGIDQNLLKVTWSPDGGRVAAGSADRLVYIWDSVTRQVVYKLPGHTGTVTEVAFHPNEPIIASCGVDKKIYLGEIEP
jgi:Prp8 binding protein